MKDEYGEMTADGETFLEKDFVLENKSVLPEAQLRYQTYGTLNKDKDNVLVVCHALTGNASLHSWWGDLLGSGKAFDTSKYFIVCCNILGSCYGSTNPQSIDPTTGDIYGKTFPDISVQDTVRLQLLLLQEGLGVSSIKSVIGGSFGGMQALEFAVQAGSKHGDFRTKEGKTANFSSAITAKSLILFFLWLILQFWNMKDRHSLGQWFRLLVGLPIQLGRSGFPKYRDKQSMPTRIGIKMVLKQLKVLK